MVSPRFVRLPWADDHDPADLIEEAAAFALQAMGADRGLRLLDQLERSGERPSAALHFSCPLWYCHWPFDPALFNAPPVKFEFTHRSSRGDWRVRPSDRHIVFMSLSMGVRLEVAMELAPGIGGDNGPVQIKSMFNLGSIDPIEDFIIMNPDFRSLRIVEVRNTGRRGFLLPKARNRDVFPLPEISMGAGTLRRRPDQPLEPIPLERFLSF